MNRRNEETTPLKIKKNTNQTKDAVQNDGEKDGEKRLARKVKTMQKNLNKR